MEPRNFNFRALWASNLAEIISKLKKFHFRRTFSKFELVKHSDSQEIFPSSKRG